ncbi:MAG: hypothetical protein M3R32_02140 [Chloroflexota bacterium]|nr:hypothetical protein [Chloroflexota bacterium]
MARRGGKAANRRDRQKRAQRRAQQRPADPGRPTGEVVSDAVGDAVEAMAERRAEMPPSRAGSPAPGVHRGPRPDPRFAVAGPSRLSERASAEYHYVRSDLRNIAVLVVVMAVLLGAAVVAFSVLGIGPS